MAKHNIRLKQGDTFKLTFSWYEPLVDEDGEAVLDAAGNIQPDFTKPIDLDGYVARMQVRETVDSDSTLLDLSTGDGIVIRVPDPLPEGHPGDVTNEVYVEASDEVTTVVDAKSGVYDLELESPGGEVSTVLEGKVRIIKQVTR